MVPLMPTPIDLELLHLLAGACAPAAGWDERGLVARAGSLRLEGAVLRSLDRDSIDIAPASRAVLEAGRLETAARALWLTDAASSMSASLAAAGIEHRLVKGLALRGYHAHPGDRWMDDVDVLVAGNDRLRVAAHLRARGARHRPIVRHDGRASRLERDLAGAELVWTSGAPIDVHFVRELPPLAPGSDALPTPAATAAALARHALVHHAGDPRFLARMFFDLRILRERGLAAVLDEQAREHRPLAHALERLDALRSRRSFHRVGLPAWRTRGHAWSVALGVARDAGLRTLWPARDYLVAHDPSAASASTFELRRRRWGRVRESLGLA